MKALILAAGIASRLRPLTDNTPKCLLKVGDKCILERAIENILHNNIRDIAIVTGYLEEQIKLFLTNRFKEVSFTYIHNNLYASTNNIYSLWLARNSVMDDDMLMMDSDIVFDHRIPGKLINSGHRNCLALKKHALGDEEIKVRADGQMRVLEISKIVKPAEAAGESIGIELFSRESLPLLYKILDKKVADEKMVNIFYEVAFEEFVRSGEEIYAIDCSEYYCTEIDTEADLHTAAENYDRGIK
ncbi:MAG TPA: phosphocholine cytidylyltransferase family protein [Bacteroidales bacterium]|nr:phosphocholine cytidylyltransferase family protein [Bacteroidales bacterium]